MTTSTALSEKLIPKHKTPAGTHILLAALATQIRRKIRIEAEHIREGGGVTLRGEVGAEANTSDPGNNAHHHGQGFNLNGNLSWAHRAFFEGSDLPAGT